MRQTRKDELRIAEALGYFARATEEAITASDAIANEPICYQGDVDIQIAYRKGFEAAKARPGQFDLDQFRMQLLELAKLVEEIRKLRAAEGRDKFANDCADLRDLAPRYFGPMPPPLLAPPSGYSPVEIPDELRRPGETQEMARARLFYQAREEVAQQKYVAVPVPPGERTTADKLGMRPPTGVIEASINALNAKFDEAVMNHILGDAVPNTLDFRLSDEELAARRKAAEAERAHTATVLDRDKHQRVYEHAKAAFDDGRYFEQLSGYEPLAQWCEFFCISIPHPGESEASVRQRLQYAHHDKQGNGGGAPVHVEVRGGGGGALFPIEGGGYHNGFGHCLDNYAKASGYDPGHGAGGGGGGGSGGNGGGGSLVPVGPYSWAKHFASGDEGEGEA